MRTLAFLAAVNALLPLAPLAWSCPAEAQQPRETQAAPPGPEVVPAPGARPQPTPYPYPYPIGPAPGGAPNYGGADAPKTMDYEEGVAVSAGYHLESKVRKGLVIGGGVTFGVFWLASVFVGYIGNAFQDHGLVETSSGQLVQPTLNDFTPLYVPLVGPWVTIATAHTDASGSLALAADGVVQAAAAAMLIAGIAAPKKELVRDDAGETRFRLLPLLGKGSVGLSLAWSR